MLALLESQAIENRLVTAGPIASGKARRWLERWLPTRLERWLVYAGLAFSALSALLAGLGLLLLTSTLELATIQNLDAGRIEFPDEPAWTILLLAVSVVTGVTSTIALVLRIGGSVRWLDVALAAVLIDLVVGELVAFYAAQFTALASAVWGVVLLGLVVDLRIRERNASAGAAVDAADG